MLTQDVRSMQTELRPAAIEVGGGSLHPDPELRTDALRVLAETSRTFYIPVSRLPEGLLEAVGSGYLCLRAIDEVEDHPELEAPVKSEILRRISRALLAGADGLGWDHLYQEMAPFSLALPEVTLRLGDWLRLPPDSIAARVWDATAAMADRMARWVDAGFVVRTESDLDNYTFGVAGAVGLLLCDLWAWYDGTPSNRLLAIGFGRGLQAVNILRNRAEDLQRGVDFYPNGWGDAEIQAYARRNLGYASEYLRLLRRGPAREFCSIPLALAYATIDAMDQGREKLTREEVVRVVEKAISEVIG
jgi:farnesyl-diphosphate farnesyltransferase